MIAHPRITHPSAAEIARAIATWIDEVRPQLDARNAYLARVAANGLAVIGRELEQSTATRQEIEQGLKGLLSREGHDDNYDTLVSELCVQLRAGTKDASTPTLLSVLRADTLAKLAVDQPNYRHEGPGATK